MRTRAQVAVPMTALVWLSSIADARAQEALAELEPVRDYTDLTLEELVNLEVSVASRKPERSLDVPAAIYTISGDEIVRTGLTSLPEALRLAPGVLVGHRDANKWAVGVRGIATRYSRAFLPLIDGRPVYTQLFAGTQWDVQDALLDDVDRIEVIRGPGGMLWGANAINGVINVLTKSAEQTHGLRVSGGAGTEERAFGQARYGGQVGDKFHYRVFGKYFDRDAAFHPDRADFDGWRVGRGGFRTDTRISSADTLTVQGDIYDGEIGQRTVLQTFQAPFTQIVDRDVDVSGGNVLGRWRRTFGEGAEISVQSFFDHAFRREPDHTEDERRFDLDFQNRLRLLPRQDVVWGLGYRLTSDDFDGTEGFFVDPSSSETSLFSAFVQDEVMVVRDRVRVTVGSKFEHNDFSGFEYQPGARVLYTPTHNQAVWGAVTRSVRTPSRFEHGIRALFPVQPQAGVFTRVIGDRNFDSERVLTYETGYRIQPIDRLLVDVAGFYTYHANYLSLRPGAPFVEAEPEPPHRIVPIFVRNGNGARTYGGELATTFDVSAASRLHVNYSFIKANLYVRREDFPTDVLVTPEDTEPAHQFSVRSHTRLHRRLELDVFGRFVDRLEALEVPSYATVDVRIGWQATDHIELSVVGQNLAQRRHAENRAEAVLQIPGLVEMERGVYTRLTLRY